MNWTRICFPLGLLVLCGWVVFIKGGAAPEPAAALPAPVGARDDLFEPLRVLKFAIEISPEALATLRSNADSHAYVRCTFREGGLSLSSVGIHCKGNAARELASGHPDFTVTFDKFISKQTFHGLRRVVLQSGGEDPSHLSAPVAFALFRQAGVPAPRCAFARIEFNGRDLGVYQVIEGENRDFLHRHFGNSDGNLYDEGETHDVTGKLDKDHGSRRGDQSDVDALVAAARTPDPGMRWRALQQHLEMDRFLAFIAIEVLLWNPDGYAIDASSFRLYHNPATDRFVFLPKGVDRVLTKIEGPAVPDCKGIVARAVLTTPEGEKRYRNTLEKLLNDVFVPEKLQSMCRDIAGTIRADIAGADASSVGKFDAAVERFQNAAVQRARFIAAQVKSAP